MVEHITKVSSDPEWGVVGMRDQYIRQIIVPAMNLRREGYNKESLTEDQVLVRLFSPAINDVNPSQSLLFLTKHGLLRGQTAYLLGYMLKHEKVKQGLFPNWGKPGEVFEFIETIHTSECQITPDLLSEAADIVYYLSQPNCPPVANQLKSLITCVGIDMELARSACIVKYGLRLEFGRLGDYKKRELLAIKNLLDKVSY